MEVVSYEQIVILLFKYSLFQQNTGICTEDKDLYVQGWLLPLQQHCCYESSYDFIQKLLQEENSTKY